MFASFADVLSYFESRGRVPSVFDGDGLEDTPPDPYETGVQCNSSVTQLVLDGVKFPLPRTNIMSYYAAIDDEAGKTLTPTQVNIVKGWIDKQDTQ